jgi:hypothetical protein
MSTSILTSTHKLLCTFTFQCGTSGVCATRRRRAPDGALVHRLVGLFLHGNVLRGPRGAKTGEEKALVLLAVLLYELDITGYLA